MFLQTCVQIFYIDLTARHRCWITYIHIIEIFIPRVNPDCRPFHATSVEKGSYLRKNHILTSSYPLLGQYLTISYGQYIPFFPQETGLPCGNQNLIYYPLFSNLQTLEK